MKTASVNPPPCLELARSKALETELHESLFQPEESASAYCFIALFQLSSAALVTSAPEAETTPLPGWADRPPPAPPPPPPPPQAETISAARAPQAVCLMRLFISETPARVKRLLALVGRVSTLLHPLLRRHPGRSGRPASGGGPTWGCSWRRREAPRRPDRDPPETTATSDPAAHSRANQPSGQRARSLSLLVGDLACHQGSQVAVGLLLQSRPPAGRSCTMWGARTRSASKPTAHSAWPA